MRSLLVGPGVVLDAGAGDGKIARALAPDVERVDAVDPSAAMIEVGRTSAGGSAANLRWIEAKLEDAVLDPPYGLATAGASIHWMDPDVVFPKLADALAPGAVLAVVGGDDPVGAPFEDATRAVLIETITRAEGRRPTYWPTPMERLERPLPEHPRFDPMGVLISKPFAVEQGVEEFLCCMHSRQSLAEEHLGPDLTAFFDQGIREALAPYASDGRIRYDVRTRVEWGRPV